MVGRRSISVILAAVRLPTGVCMRACNVVTRYTVNSQMRTASDNVRQWTIYRMQ